MFRYLLIYMACLLFAFSVKAQGISNDTIPKEVLMLDGKPMTEKQIQRYHKQLHKDSIRANKRIWWSILGGPSYTPEASFGVGGAVLASFRLNKNDTISQRSFIPAGFNITLNGTFVFCRCRYLILQRESLPYLYQLRLSERTFALFRERL